MSHQCAPGLATHKTLVNGGNSALGAVAGNSELSSFYYRLCYGQLWSSCVRFYFVHYVRLSVYSGVVFVSVCFFRLSVRLVRVRNRVSAAVTVSSGFFFSFVLPCVCFFSLVTVKGESVSVWWQGRGVRGTAFVQVWCGLLVCAP
jgi:hypothetical protein